MKFIPIGPSEAGKFDHEIRTGPSLVLFYAPGCPHCERMMPDWSRLHKHNNHKGNIIQVHADAVRDIQSECGQYVNGYPTLAKVQPGGKIDRVYEGPRDFESLARFLDENFELEKRSTTRNGSKGHGTSRTHGKSRTRGTSGTRGKSRTCGTSRTRGTSGTRGKSRTRGKEKFSRQKSESVKMREKKRVPLQFIKIPGGMDLFGKN